MKVTIKVFENEILILTKVWEKGVFRAGRSDFCDVVLPGDKVSRSAVEFRITETSVYVTNMGPSGRLKINGKKQETGELKDGAFVEISQYKLAVIFGEEAIASQSSKDEPPAENPAPDPNNILMGDPNENQNGGLFGGNTMGEINGAFGQENENNPSPEVKPELAPENPPAEVLAFPDPVESEMPIGNRSVEGNVALKEKTETVGKPLVAKVVFTEGPRKGDEIPLQSFELTLGRSAKADVVIADNKLSRVHAKIVRFGTGYRIVDLNSHNGTRVNGVRILEHPLSSFDIIEFGNTKIKFLIHDLILNDGGQSTQVALVSNPSKEPTKSLHIDEAERLEIGRIAIDNGSESLPSPEEEFHSGPEESRRSPFKILLVVILAVILSLWILYSKPPKKEEPPPSASAGSSSSVTSSKESAALPAIPKDFYELSPEMQRRIEGYYSTAVSYSQRSDLTREDLEKVRDDLRKIHQSLPYYKNSSELLEQVDKRYKDMLSKIAAKKAEEEVKQDLNLYLEEGVENLRQGEFERAAESFQLALNLEPRNATAVLGLKAAELKIRDLKDVPTEQPDPELEKRTQIKDLYEKALQALNNRAYQEAIDLAEKIRKINIKSDQTYLNEAKQIIDRAKMAQKEEFEPFLIQAKEKFSEGDYNAARDLCEEMLKRDPAYEEAKELLQKSKKNLNRLAKEAYTHGYILESIGQIEQAKQYWNRARNYVRPGDEYHDKVNKKLDQYQ